MANNKLWAVCKDHNEGNVMAKNYGDWFCVQDQKNHDQFFRDHQECPSNKGCGENIVFVTEVDDEDVLLFDFRVRPVKIYLKGQKDRIPE